MSAGPLSSELLWLLPALVAAGALTGLLAGLFGVGGGAITVPVVYQAFRIAGVPDAIAMPLSIGTSLAVIVPTSLSSTRAHLRRNAVDLDLWKRWVVPVTVGVLSGAFVARYAPPGLFKIVFIAICLFSAFRFLGGHTDWRLGEEMPRGPVLACHVWTAPGAQEGGCDFPTVGASAVMCPAFVVRHGRWPRWVPRPAPRQGSGIECR